MRTREVDEEDILVSVFDRFFRAAKEQRFAKLENRDDLWQILLMLTERRVADQYRKSHAEKRGGGNVIAVGDVNPNASTPDAIRELADAAASPEFAARRKHSVAKLSSLRHSIGMESQVGSLFREASF